ncbi:MAG: DNA-binding protein [Clostridiales Family XIII bacterium]|jgi:predicted DNA-binding protein YlxM (UPF0122 family)|nr:DNA-binding protein [Clostridiales Family XIII bacterium]
MTNEECSLLYDYYGALLSERQREVFGLYYEENYSLSEIAANLGVSRQAVHIALNKASSSLKAFEGKLGLVAKHAAYEKALKEVLAKADGILKDSSRAAAIDPAALKDLRRIKKLIKDLDI